MKKFSVVAIMVLVALSMMVTPSLAANNGGNGKGSPSSTTLDACNYFVGTETSSNSKESTTDEGATTVSERGTWVGVSNNYGGGQVASLGTVKGSYYKVTTTDADGSVSGTETFNSGAGKIDQTFSFSGATGWVVSVTATRDLAFLTSDTNGSCYSGEFPRP